MLKLEFEGDNGDKFEVNVNSRDIMKWERTTKGKSFVQMEDSLRMEDLYKLGWIAACREGSFSGTLPDLEASYDLLLEKEPEEDKVLDVDPTQTEA